MSDPMQEIMASFFVECEELLEALLDALQLMTDDEDDVEMINVAFRSVHSIKDGAGAFGLDDLVSFAHQFETVMDHCRDGSLKIDKKLIDLFYRCCDMLSDLVRCSRDGLTFNSETSSALIAELAAYSSHDTVPQDAEPIDFQPLALDLDDFFQIEDLPVTPDQPIDLEEIFEASAPTGGLLVNFSPELELYASGNEPLFLLQTLSDLGPNQVDISFQPPDSINDLGVLGKRLSWSIKVDTEEDPASVLAIFEFADGLCKLDVRQCEFGEVALADMVAPLPNVIPDPKPESTENGTKVSPTVRVDLERIERLVNLVGELVINQAMLSQSIAEEDIHPNSPIFSGLDEFMQLTRNIQESVMMIRAQPVKSLFQRMSRIVREASSAVDKNVRLVTEGENTEIDKTAIERLADPLTHMIRNAVDHGLERAQDRLLLGKSEVGTIRLKAAHKSGRVIIEVSDDGAGINRERVRAKAIEKGLISEDAILSDSEIDQLLFLPGFSTAAEVSNLSGRGVGMDVVKTQVAAMGGRISIESRDGEGSKFTISLPLTLAVLDGMVITVAGETLVVPINTIVETLSLSHDDLRYVSPNQYVIRVREKFVAVLDLGIKLGYRTETDLTKGAIALLISPEEGNLVALLVDQIEDQRQVVIKGLQDSYGRVPGVAAATILGDGQVALILDPADLVQEAAIEDAPMMAQKVS